MTPFEILNEVKRRSAEAVIAQSGLAHDGLRRHLRALLGGDDPGIGAMLQEPVLEGAHPFVTADATMAAMTGSLLHADLVAALGGLPAGHDYRFPRTRRPFLHQAEAWRLLAEPEPQSVLVTSGTGSGKNRMLPLSDPERSGRAGTGPTRAARRRAGDHALSSQRVDREPARTTLCLDAAIRRKGSILPLQWR